MSGRSTVDLPKAHLHLHLEGSMRPETLKELAESQNKTLEGFWEFEDEYDFYERYKFASEVISSLDDLSRICFELIEDEAGQGVTYSQPGVAPQVFVPQLGSMEDVYAAMQEGFERASALTGVVVGCMIEVDVSRSSEELESVATFAAQQRGRGVDAFGIATAFDPAPDYRPFARLSQLVKEAGLLFVPHAGEHDGVATIRDSLTFLHADRIAHGVKAIDDSEVLERLAAERVACDICPTSNLRLKVVRDVGALPIPQFLEAGVPLTINADDQLFFGSKIADEYALVRETFDLSDEELGTIARTSGEVSGAPSNVVAKIRDGVEDWLSSDPS